MCNSDSLLAIACSTYLQCTTMGPALTGLEEVTFLTNCSNGVGESGTPWSGQTVKWNCRTILSSWEPSFWREKVRTVYSARTSTSWMWTRIDPCTAFFSSGQYLWHFSWERKTTRILDWKTEKHWFDNTAYPPPLLQICEHDNGGWPLLPH